MDYKKKYEQALAKAKNMIDDLRKGEDILAVSELESMFPELAESEDEKLRKTLIEYFNAYPKDYFGGLKKSYILAWLEKQGENKSFDNKNQEIQNSHKFNIGDIISNGNVEFRVDNIVKNYIGQDCYFLVNIKDEKNGNRYLRITDLKGNTHYAGETTWLCEQVDAKFEKQGEQKSQRTISAEAKEALYNKPAWSEEDEVRLQACLDTLQAKSLMGKVDTVMTEWLKSLKDRVQPIHEYSDTEKQEMFLRSQRPHFWRPSDEQMKALEYVAYHLMPDTNYRKEMFSLYEDLKKLKA